MTLQEIIDCLRDTPRKGYPEDIPEGSRTISISDTLANKMADYLEGIKDR